MESADVALFYRVDRVARSLLDFVGIMRQAEDHGVALVSATESIATSTPTGRAMLQIVAIFAEMESRTISARGTSSVDFLRRNGRRAGGQVPWGWRNAPNPKGAGYVLVLTPSGHRSSGRPPTAPWPAVGSHHLGGREATCHRLARPDV